MAEFHKGEPPTGEPHLNPFTPEDIEALLAVLHRGPQIADAIRRAHHVGLDVEAHADKHEMHQGVATRIIAMYGPKRSQIEE